MQLDTITELLDIPNYKVTHVIQNDGSSLHFIVDQVEPLPPVCSGCGRVHSGGIHSVGMNMVEDMPISGKRVFLHVPRRKVRCPEDGTIRVEEIAWIRKRFSLRFAEQVYRLTAIATNQEAGWYLGLDDETVYRIDKCMLEKLAQEKLDSLVAPTMMSVDEVSWQKRHKYVNNVIDIQKRKVIWNHNGRGKYVLDKFYRRLGPEGCENIQAVASDGARGFLSSTKTFAKNALIVLDHFHVKKSLNDALDTVRKEELRKAQKENNDELSQILHCNQRFILMQSKKSKRKMDVLNKLAVLNERIYQAMLLKEQFLAVYKTKDQKTARSFLAVRSTKIDHLSVGKDRSFRMLSKLLEAENTLLIAELTTLAATMRKETRGAHNREDYPQTVEEWSKNIVFQHKDGKMIVKTKPVNKVSTRMI